MLSFVFRRFIPSFGAAMFVAASGAVAQDHASATYGDTTISIGGGAQFLKLPDVRFTFLSSERDGRALTKQKNSILDDYGGAASGSIETPLGFWGGTRVTGVLSGSYANVETSNRRSCVSAGALCTSQSIVDHPDGPDSLVFPNGFTSKANRDVDFWGVGAEARFGDRPAPVPDQGGYLFRFAYWGIGTDVRGIDQTIKLRLDTPSEANPVTRYDETLDTTYWGGYLTIGGEYNILGYLGIGESWGLRSLIALRGGVYNAETDYRGTYASPRPTDRLALTKDETTFIGGVSFETRKQLGARTSLSLLTDYEYLSYAPEMRYVDADRSGCGSGPGTPQVDCAGNISRTQIGDDDAFAVRTVLRLNIGLGPTGLYQEAPPYK